MRRHHGFHLHELLGRHGLDLVTGLQDLEIADRGLALLDKACQRLGVAFIVAHGLGNHQ